MSLYQRNGVWHVDIWRAGRPRIRRSAGTTDKARAQQVHDELAARTWKERESGRHFSDALAVWVKAKPRSIHELNSVKQIARVIKDRPLSAMSEAVFLQAFSDKTPGTYNRLSNIVRSALNMAVRHEWMGRAPEIGRRKPEQFDPMFLTESQWKRLSAELPAHLKPMAAFAIATGLRWANVAGLTWDRVDLEGKRAWIPASKAKGRKAIPIPLSAAAVAALQSVPGEGYVFTYHGRPINSAKTAWAKATARAGVPGCRFHDLRHTWASRHVQSGTPLAVLKELGGWASIDMVLRYAHLAPGHLAQYADNSKPKNRRLRG